MQKLTILALLALTFGLMPAHADQRAALVIGHATLEQAKIEALKKPQVAQFAPPPSAQPPKPGGAIIEPPGQSEPPPAGSTGAMPWMAPLIEKDRGRIARIDETRAKALAKAAGSNSANLLAARKLLDAAPQLIDVGNLPGNWQCRSIKIAGDFEPVSIGPFFACRFRKVGGNLLFEKLTGSIRRSAPLAVIDDYRLLYYGAYFAQGDRQKPYGQGDYNEEVGVLWRASRTRLLLELPEPNAYAEALHEVIELVRQ
jgi:hypothetical protein